MKIIQCLIFSGIASLQLLLFVSSNAYCQIYFDVVTVNTIGDTILVDVSPSSIPSCGDTDCFYHDEYTLKVSPCPLYPPPSSFIDCTDNVWTYAHTIGIQHLRLLKGETYNFYGSYAYVGYYYLCTIPCKEEGPMDLKIYPADYVLTEISSWGKIKAIYRYSIELFASNKLTITCSWRSYPSRRLLSTCHASLATAAEAER
jgi:hypothetical protein